MSSPWEPVTSSPRPPVAGTAVPPGPVGGTSSYGGWTTPTSPPAAPTAPVSRPPAWTPPNPPPPLPASSAGPRRASSSAGAWRVVGMALLVVALLAAGFVAGRLTADAGGPEGAQRVPSAEELRQAGLPTEAPVTGSSEEPVAAVAQAVAPAVVQIETNVGLGSGVVYDPDGLIITNNHVVEGSSQVRVRLGDGSTVEGEVLGTDPSTDIGVVKIPADAVVGVAVLALGEDVQVGQLAVAVGSPFGFEQTVTSGIVSAVDRPFPNEQIVVGMIQTDAPINQGNSGGALADRSGRIIGINTAIISTSGDNNGLGFAIPIDLAFERAQRLAAGEAVEAPLLGVRGEPTDDGSPGAQLVEITPDTAAARAGLQVGDVVTAIDGEDVRSFDELAAQIGTYLPGDDVDLQVERGGSEISVTVTLGAR